MKQGQKISQAGMENRRKLEYQAREHAHLEKMAVLNWLAANDENILIMGAMGGMASSAVGKILGAKTKEDMDKESSGTSAAKDTYLGGLIVGSPILGTLAKKIVDSGGYGTKEDLMSMVGGSVSSMGDNVAAMCLGLLILKNIGPALNGIGEMIPG